jgi:hypothetical protein
MLASGHGARRLGRAALWFMVMFWAIPGIARAGTITLAWNANPEPGIAGYILYYGTTPGAYSASINVGNKTSYVFTEPQEGRVYYFALQAFNVAGVGGPLSTEISSTTLNHANYDGDDKSDFVTYNPADGKWNIYQSATGTILTIQWGLSSDIPLTGDYDGDGKSDIAVFRPSSGMWFILQSSSRFDTSIPVAIQWGTTGDVPFLGDFDGDGRGDLTVFRPSNGYWLVRFANGTTSGLLWGATGDIPLLGDFDGDRKADPTVYRPSTGTWFVTSSRYGYTSFGWWARTWGGAASDKPLIGDYDGDGSSDLTIYRGAEGRFYVWRSAGNFLPGNYMSIQWGTATDRPISADFDGDRKTDVAVFRPSNGYWYVRTSSSGFASAASYLWSVGGDIPIGR